MIMRSSRFRRGPTRDATKATFVRQLIRSYNLMLNFHGIRLVNSDTGLLGCPVRPRRNSACDRSQVNLFTISWLGSSRWHGAAESQILHAFLSSRVRKYSTVLVSVTIKNTHNDVTRSNGISARFKASLPARSTQSLNRTIYSSFAGANFGRV